MQTAERTPAQASTIRQALDILADPGSVVEIRGLHVPSGRGKPSTVAGYFSDLDEAAAAAADLDKRKAGGVYIVLNKINPALSARSPNQLTDNLTPLAGDNDILRRNWLPIDFDPDRPAGISAAENEHCAAEDTARNCAAWLQSLGWPAPILADSGNGFHLLYRIDLPADDSGLVRRCLEVIAEKMDSADVKVDRKVFNPARIWKLYGTTARKGHSTADRPHRLAQVVEVPDSVEVVDVEQLQALAAAAEKPEPSRPTGNGQHESRLDIPRWLNDRGVIFHQKDRPDRYGRTIYLLEQCPFDSSHGPDSETAIYQSPDGKLAAGCMHNSCTGRGWQEFKKAIGPPAAEHYDPPLSHQDNAAAKPYGGSDATESLDKPIFSIISAQELDSETHVVHFHIRDLMPKGIPTLHGGAIKTCKTLTAIEAGVSVASGTPFLGYFETGKPTNTIYFCGEGGKIVLQDYGRRTAASKGLALSEIDRLWFCDKLPQFANLSHLDELKRIIHDMQAELVFLDPAYLGLQTDREGSIFSQGPLLRRLNETILEQGATPVLLHHTRKSVADPMQPGELADLSWAGFAEYAGTWWIWTRREKYNADRPGVHKLWLNAGSRLGCGGLFALDVSEGSRADPGGRHWSVEVRKPDEVHRDEGDRKEQARQELAELQLEQDRRAVVDCMARIKRPETMRAVRDMAGVGNGQRFTRAWASLLSDGTVFSDGEITKGNRQVYEAFKLREGD